MLLLASKSVENIWLNILKLQSTVLQKSATEIFNNTNYKPKKLKEMKYVLQGKTRSPKLETRNSEKNETNTDKHQYRT